MRKTLLTLTLAAAPFAAWADTLDDLKAQGFARIAIANEPPFTAVAADGTVSGAAPDVAREIFKRLGVPEVVASISEYGAMIPGLQARRHDAITAGLFMKPERCQAVAYSEPVLCDAEAFLVDPVSGKLYLVTKQAFTSKVFEALAELRDLGCALVLVEEQAGGALELADTVVIMNLGRVAWSGPAAEVDLDRLGATYMGTGGPPTR